MHWLQRVCWGKWRQQLQHVCHLHQHSWILLVCLQLWLFWQWGQLHRFVSFSVSCCLLFYVHFIFSFFLLDRHIDVNECSNSTLNNCVVTLATCTNTIGSYYCTCKLGYSGNGTVCVDVNECLLGTNNCAPQATCHNTIGSFTCTCNIGYNGTGVVCIGLVFLCSCLLSCFSFRNLTQNLKLQTSMSVSWGPMTAVPMRPVSTLLDLFVCTCNSGFLGSGVLCLGNLLSIPFFLPLAPVNIDVPLLTLFLS